MKLKMFIALALSTVLNYGLWKVLQITTSLDPEILSIIRSGTGLTIAFCAAMLVYKLDDKKNLPTT